MLKTKIKTLIKVFIGKKSYLSKETKIDNNWYGNHYGGFYVHPNLLKKSSIVYSFGIGEDISFDKDIIKKHGCSVYAFDPTPKSISWIKEQELPSNFKYFTYGIDDLTGYVYFNLPKNNNHVSGSIIEHNNVYKNNSVKVPMKKFDEIIKELGHKKIDLLKMDIEGSEYRVIDNILSSPIEIDQILIEIHERYFSNGKKETRKLLNSLRNNGYSLFAISDSFEELSFIKTNTV